MNKRPTGLFADKSHKIFSKIEFVNALTPKEISTLNSKYSFLGLCIKQIVVDNYGNEKNKKESVNSDLLCRKRYRNNFNSLKDFLYKYYGAEDSFSIKKKAKKQKKRKLSGNESNKKYTKVDLYELRNGLNSIKEDCKKIEYKSCKNENDFEFKSKIVGYILNFKKYLSNAQYSLLFNKWKNELSKIKGIDLFNLNKNNDLFNWKISILKAFKSEIVLFAMCNICDNLIEGETHHSVDNKKVFIDDKMKEEEDKKNESTDSNLSQSSDDEDVNNNFNDNQALLLQFIKNANNDEENL